MNDASRDAEDLVHSFLSPEAVRLDFPVSGPAPRMLAYAIDVVAMSVLVFFVLLFVMMALPIGTAVENWFKAAVRAAGARATNTHAPPADHFDGLLIAVFLLSEFIIETGYFIFWEVATGGRSPGKYLVGLRVVRRNGLPIDLRSSIVRNLMRIVDMLPAEYLVGIISILVSPSGERLGDHVAGTIVVRLDRPESAGEIPAVDDGVALVLTRDQLARIGPREVQLLRNVLRRSSALPASRRESLIADVARTLRARLELDATPGVDDLAFLRGVLAAAERSLRS